MVGDIHRTLLYGGLFLYPADNKNKSGKLRLNYEANPMAMLVENAGGKASTGEKVSREQNCLGFCASCKLNLILTSIGYLQRVLEVMPEELHQRVPIYIGSPGDVDEVVKYAK